MRRYPWIEKPQPLQYLVAHCVEDAAGCAHHFQYQLSQKGLTLTTSQISGALQRLKKLGVVSNRGGYWSMI